jgi:hypothetical protein
LNLSITVADDIRYTAKALIPINLSTTAMDCIELKVMSPVILPVAPGQYKISLERKQIEQKVCPTQFKAIIKVQVKLPTITKTLLDVQ